MRDFFERVGDLYQRDIVDPNKQPQFFILISFLLAFLAVRFMTHSIRDQRFTKIFRNVSGSGGRHIHHLVWGILLLLVTGFIAVGFAPEGNRELLAILFGIGAALTLDEFALWLNLEDVYWAEQGRTSIDAVIVFAALVGLFTLGIEFWINVGREIGRLVR
ncbi:MAG: hypothetical protein ACRDJE_22215 [Dehalococcoidia bacterium]